MLFVAAPRSTRVQCAAHPLKAHAIQSLLLDHSHDLGAFRAVAQLYHVTPADVRMGNVLQRLCGRGHLVSLRWLAHAFSLTAADARVHNISGLRWACENGHLALAQWLVMHFDFSAPEIEFAQSYPRSHKHSNMSAWLRDEFGID